MRVCKKIKNYWLVLQLTLDKIKKTRTTVRYLDFGDLLFPVDRVGSFLACKNHDYPIFRVYLFAQSEKNVSNCNYLENAFCLKDQTMKVGSRWLTLTSLFSFWITYAVY